MSPALGLSLVVALLVCNAFFVAAEFALILARRTQIEPAAQAGSRRARLALRGIENLTRAIAACQLGITMSSLGLGAVAEPTAAALLEPVFTAAGLSEVWVHALAFGIALITVTFAHAVLGEMVPKNLALAGPERAALILTPILLAVGAVFRPVVALLDVVARAAVRLLGIEPKSEVAAAFTQEEVAGLVEESRREGLLDDHEYGLVTGALEFSLGTVEQVVLGLESLVSVTVESTIADVEQACASTGFSRFPVLEGGDLTGYLHVKDVLEADQWRPRPLATVGVATGLYDALRAMQRRGAHMAKVADADGTTVGVVMLEDVLEELVGEVRPSRPNL